MTERTIEDKLREEYFDLLPKMVKVAESFTAEIEYLLRVFRKDLKSHENLTVKARIKDCVSAIDKLRQTINPSDPAAKRNPGGVFDRDSPDKYSLLLLRDLVGVRILVFPSKRAGQVDRELRGNFQSWQSDPIVDGEKQLAYKYNGRRFQDRAAIPCEYQITSTLIGLFWEVEHAAIYKQSPEFKGLVEVMQPYRSAVYGSLEIFEKEFEVQINRSEREKPFTDGES